MHKKAAEVIFLAGWILCGCGIDGAIQSIKGMAVMAIAILVTIVAAAVIAGE